MDWQLVFGAAGLVLTIISALLGFLAHEIRTMKTNHLAHIEEDLQYIRERLDAHLYWHVTNQQYK